MNDVCAVVEVNSTCEAASASLERNEPNYQCDDCKMAFGTLSLLTEHKKTHGHGEVQSSFKCQDCDKSFRSNYPLMLHQRVHSGARPFECEVLNIIKNDKINRKWIMFKILLAFHSIE